MQGSSATPSRPAAPARSLVALALVLGCNSRVGDQTGAPPAPPTPAPELAPFDRLVSRVERDHDFAASYERNVGHPWRDDVPGLRDELVRATTRDQRLVAFAHLQNSLRDGHCYVDPPPGTAEQRLELGIELWPGGTFAAPELRVVAVAPDVGGDIAVGDSVVAVDGTPLAGWVAANRFEARSLAPADALADILATVADVTVPWTPRREGDRRVLTLARGGARHDITLQFGTHASTHPHPNIDHAPPLAEISCDPIDYGAYAVSEVGINLCVYRPTSRTRPRIAIVRYLSFLYTGGDRDSSLRSLKIDHDLLAKALADADGVILDLHENRGGNAPFKFLSWFSSGPIDFPRVVTKVSPELDANTLQHLLGSHGADTYLAAQRKHEPSYVTHFYCAEEPCTNVSLPSDERVTRAPVAVITGSECASSCDTFSSEWAVFHLGPIVGMQPRHAYTTTRLPIEVDQLGTFRIALSHNELQAGVSMEGEPIHLDWEAPHTFDTRDSWLRTAVDEASKRLNHRAGP
ncbi:MAG TPA: S41 family peptidase [Kofleriaceae bacterium]|nr:S41 family peptidase [Kofleriaceae bacterium]